MSSATPPVSNAWVMPGALFTTKVSAAHTINITTAKMIPRSIFLLTSNCTIVNYVHEVRWTKSHVIEPISPTGGFDNLC